MSLREEQIGTIFMGGGKENYKPGAMNNIILPENQILIDAQKLRDSKDAEEAKKLYIELQKKKQEELDAKLQTLEMIPMYDKVILLPYPQNPYRKAMQGSIIVDYVGSFKNPDSGEDDTLQTFVGCAQVIEVGPLTKYVKEGDDVFYDTRTVYPVPFLSLGYKLTQENALLCVLNDKLKERFKME